MIGEPPVSVGGENETFACALPAIALRFVGGPGGPIGAIGVTLFDGADADPVPWAFVAVAVNVYAVPLTSPVIVCVVDVVPAFASIPPGGSDVTV